MTKYLVSYWNKGYYKNCYVEAKSIEDVRTKYSNHIIEVFEWLPSNLF